jgi:hypothetical protein
VRDARDEGRFKLAVPRKLHVGPFELELLPEQVKDEGLLADDPLDLGADLVKRERLGDIVGGAEADHVGVGVG